MAVAEVLSEPAAVGMQMMLMSDAAWSSFAGGGHGIMLRLCYAVGGSSGRSGDERSEPSAASGRSRVFPASFRQ